jgi:hypothetical protein
MHSRVVFGRSQSQNLGLRSAVFVEGLSLFSSAPAGKCRYGVIDSG